MVIKIEDSVGKAVNPGVTKQKHNPVKSVTTLPVKMSRFSVKTKGGSVYDNT
ncbi:hypothetical protein LCGC14_2211680 [marine sediment metagenome]|uniref:Uncharacterized protein n=1 Tax=marine sediment metagenome TaxID=412755 RepID=A0A0F9DDU3_9ZZZZ